MTVANSLRAMHEQNKGEITKTNLFMAELDLLHEEEGFNTRDYNDPEVVEHIRNLAEAYKAGEDLPPLKVKVVDGQILVRDGHCRRRAALLAREEGTEIARLPVLETKGDEIEQSLIILTSNEGLKLKPLSQAKVYVRLIALGLSPEEVAARVRKTTAHVDQYVELDGLPVKLKKLINNGTVTFTLALQLFRKHGSKAADIILANQKGDKKVTQKSVESFTGYRTRITGETVVKVTDTLEAVVQKLEVSEKCDPELFGVTVTFTAEEAEALRSLYDSVKVKKEGD